MEICHFFYYKYNINKVDEVERMEFDEAEGNKITEIILRPVFPITWVRPVGSLLRRAFWNEMV